jgi:Tfp pilus assembly protein PilV
MIRTYFGRLRRTPRETPSAEAGFALLEVLISAVIVALIVIATFTGFDASNRATASERAHAQADVIAQQDEDRLRSMQIGQVATMNETRTVKYKETEFTIVSTGEFIADATGSTSCSSVAEEASYVRTASKVTWPGLGSRPPVVETSLITPPAGGALLVQVTNARSAPVSGVTVKAEGPSPSTAVTSAVTGAKGCVIFAALAEGTYKVTAHETGYIDKTGNTEPELTTTVVPGTTDKKSFEIDQPGAIAVGFEPTSGAEATGDTFVVQNPSMPTPSFKSFGTLGTYEPTVTSPMALFPFGSPSPPAVEATGQYSVYAGTCEANAPEKFGVVKPPSINVLPNATVSIKVPLPAINLKVMSGGAAVTNGFSGSVKDEECGGALHKFPVTISAAGELHKGMPFGKKFSLCVVSKEPLGGKYRKVKNILIANESPSGTALTTISLTSPGIGEREERNSPVYTCP